MRILKRLLTTNFATEAQVGVSIGGALLGNRE